MFFAIERFLTKSAWLPRQLIENRCVLVWCQFFFLRGMKKTDMGKDVRFAEALRLDRLPATAGGEPGI